jgi:phenylpropionate dioxygenase-like ring-hydroxylating dioxygenase large terminal subunit
MSAMARCWFIAASSREVGARPIAREILGRPMVLFRGVSGEVVALADRCPHRGVPLSLGTVERGAIVCRYHGWRFDARGACVDVPCAGPDDGPPRARVAAYPTRELGDTIYVCVDGNPAGEPTRWPLEEHPGAASCQAVVHFPAGLEPVLHNFFDPGHPGFVHPQAVQRPDPEKHKGSLSRAHIEETPTGLRVEYSRPYARQLPRPRRGRPSLFVLSLRALMAAGHIPPAKKHRYWEELVFPSTIRAHHHFSDERQFIQSFVCTPENEKSTRVTMRFEARVGPTSPLLALLLRRRTLAVIDQDVAIVKSQAEALARYGDEGLMAATADGPNAWLTRALRRFESGEWGRSELGSKDIEFWM